VTAAFAPSLAGPRRARAFAVCGGVLLCSTLLGACRSGDGSDGRAPAAASPAPTATALPAATPTATAVASSDEVQRLKALGYVDVAEEPADGRSGVVKRDPAHSYPGYNLFTNAFTCSTEIIAGDGRLVHRWSREPCFRWDNTTLLPDGDLLVVGRDGKADPGRAKPGSRWRQGQYLARLAWDGRLRWERRINAHHDAELAPNGLISVLTGEDRRIPEVDPDDDVSTDKLTLLSPDGDVVEEASLYEMLRAAPGFVVQPRPKKGEDNSDLLHTNAIDWMRSPELAAKSPLYAAGNVLVCMRHQDAIAMIDWKARKVVWHWGQGELSGPHDAQVLPNGHILLFDNGIARKWSRVIELDPIAERIVWEWKADDPKSFFTLARGSNQRLPNGNTLIAESDAGRALEVDAAGEVVWEFLNPTLHEGKRVAIVRMRRLESPLVDRLLAGGGAPPAESGSTTRTGSEAAR